MTSVLLISSPCPWRMMDRVQVAHRNHHMRTIMDAPTIPSPSPINMVLMRLFSPLLLIPLAVCRPSPIQAPTSYLAPLHPARFFVLDPIASASPSSAMPSLSIHRRLLILIVIVEIASVSMTPNCPTFPPILTMPNRFDIQPAHSDNRINMIMLHSWIMD